MKEGESMSEWARSVGEGQGVFLEGNQEGIWICDLEDGVGGHRVTWGRLICRLIQRV